ncbi:hypothetical protein NEMIN01_1822 [Nematocida minor]|uniref:uncharacterized protein n=1 Tax=Nematocida minor TaxID=1912983 RepID=UPI00221F192D|nr:uncharacterized protein NEMIN01_1822 [Nematocida minor]KAI5192126.1 hypothetical protein NEMIN01_1822 [Nematocida minor]
MNRLNFYIILIFAACLGIVCATQEEARGEKRIERFSIQLNPKDFTDVELPRDRGKGQKVFVVSAHNDTEQEVNVNPDSRPEIETAERMSSLHFRRNLIANTITNICTILFLSMILGIVIYIIYLGTYTSYFISSKDSDVSANTEEAIVI